MTTGPAITLRREAQHLRISYRRADLQRIVCGLPADRALTLIPTLLPICAGAQQIAAARAVQACRGETESASQHASREQQLLREQALAAAWRLLVDWPRYVHRPPNLEMLKQLRQLSDDALGVGLGEMLGVVLPRPQRHRSNADLIDQTIALMRGARGAMGLLFAAALNGTRQPDLPVQLLTGLPLQRRAADCLEHGHSQPLAAGEAPVAVGPLAMQRHPLCVELAARSDLPLPARLLLAMLFDMSALAEALRTSSTLPANLPVQEQLENGSGLGYACTARGPLFHRISLDSDARITDWRYLAPTDWHFADHGLVAALAGTLALQGDALTTLVAAADPCAPWTIETGDDEPLQEVA